jgi:hypothetical protein
MKPHDDQQSDRMARIWDDLVRGAPPPDADPDLLAEILEIRSWAAVPPPSAKVRASIWQGLTSADPARSVQRPHVGASPNGHVPVPATIPAAGAAKPAAVINWPALYRTLAVGAISGFAAGFGAGIWTRIAMRVAGALTADRNRYFLTENGEVVGRITLGGTLGLALFVAILGTIGGVLYLAIRRWIPGPPLIRAAGFGVLLLAVFGFVLMDETSRDYQLFGPAWLNVGTFSLTYLVYGILTSIIAERLDDRMPRPDGSPVRGRGRVLAWIAVTPFALIGAIAIMTVMITAVFNPTSGILACLLLLAGVAHLMLRRQWQINLLNPRVQWAMGVVTLAPGLFGVWLTIEGILGILSG